MKSAALAVPSRSRLCVVPFSYTNSVISCSCFLRWSTGSGCSTLSASSPSSASICSTVASSCRAVSADCPS